MEKMMRTYIVQYRINGGCLETFDTVDARSPAGAIAIAAWSLTDIQGAQDIRHGPAGPLRARAAATGPARCAPAFR